MTPLFYIQHAFEKKFQTEITVRAPILKLRAYPKTLGTCRTSLQWWNVLLVLDLVTGPLNGYRYFCKLDVAVVGIVSIDKQMWGGRGHAG